MRMIEDRIHSGSSRTTPRTPIQTVPGLNDAKSLDCYTSPSFCINSFLLRKYNAGAAAAFKMSVPVPQDIHYNDGEPKTLKVW